MKIALALFATGMFATGAYAGPLSLTDAQMDAVAAGGVETTDGFICPVISTDAVLNSTNGIAINGAYSILGPDVAVPVLATNAEGAGSPGGSYSSPGDTDYTAIWAK
jgi:hypothetical protein